MKLLRLATFFFFSPEVPLNTHPSRRSITPNAHKFKSKFRIYYGTICLTTNVLWNYLSHHIRIMELFASQHTYYGTIRLTTCVLWN
jgi:hypothetical protein